VTVQKEQKTRRGRPREFDEAEVLAQARNAFWRAGYQATSLDDLSEATGLKRPSLYGAFGDKADLYLAALSGYREGNLVVARRLLTEASTLRAGLEAVYAAALNIYLRNNQGCFILGTAPCEAETSAPVRAQLRGITDDLDSAFAERIKIAQKAGELSKLIDAQERGRLASAMLHSLSVRARSGEKRVALETMAESAVNILCA